jgi:hypothetical protein
MSDYERMVSYFYRYENGTKSRNAGFGKVECRQEKLRVTMDLTDESVVEPIALQLYLYRYDKGKMHLTNLCSANMQNGELKVHEERQRTECLPESAFLSDYSGIIVALDGQVFFGSQWNDEVIRMMDFEQAVLSENTANAVQTTESEPERSAEQEETVLETDLQTEETSEQASEENAELETLTAANETQSSKEDSGVTDTLTLVQQLANWQKETNERNRQKKEEHPNSREAMQEREVGQHSGKLTGIPFLLENRDHLPDFGNHTITRCVKIQPEDIGLLKRSNWEYGNNSFVMHGFYNYHYLLLGCMQYQDGSSQYVLGIPGIFSNRDKYLAQIFNFYEFVPVRACAYKTGEFGYWIGKLK